MRRSTRRLVKYASASLLFFCSVAFVTKTLLPSNKDAEDALGKSPVKDKAQTLSEEKLVPEKKDWHNYAQIQSDLERMGPGEQGQAYHLEPGHEKERDELYKVNGFNGLGSDHISLNRSLKDIRHKGCKLKKYLSVLPTASVIVPFHNEHWSTLLRTATSVISRSPPELIKEVVLVDDGSTKDFLKDDLDSYCRRNLPKVKVVHFPKRTGLIHARLRGARAATGDVLIFLDSHTEVNVNWLPPLLEPIAINKRTVVCPFIDVVDFDNFEYRAQDEGARGSFDWEFFYKRLPVLPEDELNMPEPFKSPVMAGGLFAISAEFFWELGGYDEELMIWGGEQYELSFKLWMCGGTMVDAPCSRIGHIYRKFAPFPDPGIGDFVGRNYRRVAEVWMDEYAEYLYKRRPHYREISPGDISKQKQLRQQLKCKSFKWFMENVAFDQPKKYPAIEPPDFAHGEIRSKADPSLCVDSRFKGQTERFGLEECLKDNINQGGEQSFSLTWHKDVRPTKRSICWDVSEYGENAPILLWGCHGMQGNQLWKYDEGQQWLVHGGNPRCLDSNPGNKELYVSACDPNSITQKWVFENVDSERIQKHWDDPLSI